MTVAGSDDTCAVVVEVFRNVAVEIVATTTGGVVSITLGNHSKSVPPQAARAAAIMNRAGMYDFFME